MELEPVSSSQVAAIGYDPQERKLQVKFISNGAVYEYDNVSAAEHQSIMMASSVGRQLRFIVASKPYRKLG